MSRIGNVVNAMSLFARNGVWLSKGASLPALDASDAARTDGLVDAVASGDVRLASLRSNIYLRVPSSGSICLGAGVLSDSVAVREDAVVVGAPKILLAPRSTQAPGGSTVAFGMRVRDEAMTLYVADQAAAHGIAVFYRTSNTPKLPLPKSPAPWL